MKMKPVRIVWYGMGWDGDAMGMEGEDLSARRVHLGVILLRTTYPEFSARGRGVREVRSTTSPPIRTHIAARISRVYLVPLST